MPSARAIPSIDDLLQRPALSRAILSHGRSIVTAAARRAAASLRDMMRAGADGLPSDGPDVLAWLEARAIADITARLSPSLRPVINATGVLLHTNLGRAPLAADAVEAVARIARGYSNLEYDLARGERGHRHVHAEWLLTDLTGAGAALVVNNNAAAALVVLAALAAGREVIVSRGELVEIGGGFRVPEVLAQSGATLREVGTTNRTRLNDYAAAIGDRTAMLLRVHRSNFRIEGFTEQPALADLTALGRQFNLPVVEDQGSGWIGAELAPGELQGETSVADSLGAGVDLVLFSGDKLLGGPQAGLIAGRSDLVDRVRKHPLMRAVRADKLVYAALEATLALWAQPAQRGRLPVWRMLTLAVEDLDRRARAVAAALAGTAAKCQIREGFSTTGGGSAPESQLPTRLLALRVEGQTASAVDQRLRSGDPPVVARIERDEVLLDLRTVADDDDTKLAEAIRRVCPPR
jgi:L-seryl-tRNA(Ser) seleniumtransferase